MSETELKTSRYIGHLSEGPLRFRNELSVGTEAACSFTSHPLNEIITCERAKARKEMVRMCYSEKLVGLARNAKISAAVHRRAGPEAVKTFAALLSKEGTKG